METGKDKVKKICDLLRQETLEPAMHEADTIVAAAKEEADRIVTAGRKAAEKLILEARKDIERQNNVFQSSLTQACKQALESLKQEIEEKLFNRELGKILQKPLADPKVLASLIEAVVKAIDKEGMQVDLSAYVPAAVPAEHVNQFLAREIIQRLKEKSVLVGSMTGGIEVKLHNENMTIDLSDTALKELVANYIRKDFRSLILA